MLRFITELEFSAHKALKNPSNAIQVQYKDKLYFHNVKSRHLRMSYGEFGCALSHINIVLKHSPNPCLFLEDDARIDDLQEFLIQLRNLPSFDLFDICYFQNESIWYPPQSNMFLNEHFALNIKRGINCTHGYLLSGRGMQMFKNYITHTSQIEFNGQMHGLFVNVPSDDILSGLCRDGIMISISPGRRLLSTNKATSDIWNIYKYNEKHTSVVWDKPPVPNYKIYLSDNLPLHEQIVEYGVAKIVSCQKLCQIVKGKGYIIDKIFKNIDYDNDYDYNKQLIIPDFDPILDNALSGDVKLKLTSVESIVKLFKENDLMIKELFEFRSAKLKQEYKNIKDLDPRIESIIFQENHNT